MCWCLMHRLLPKVPNCFTLMIVSNYAPSMCLFLKTENNLFQKQLNRSFSSLRESVTADFQPAFVQCAKSCRGKGRTTLLSAPQ